MFSFGKSKRIVNIVINDYMIRILENNGKDLSSITTTTEKLLPEHTIENGKIIDDISFYNFLKDVVTECNLKNKYVRFYVPDELIIMREITLNEKVEEDELKQYITMEIGHTIHFPFTNIVFDIYDTSKLESENKVTIFAAPEDDIIKYVDLFTDVKLKPTEVGAKPLGTYRFFLFQENEPREEDTYLFYELNLVSSNISIFKTHHIELLRFQSLNVPLADWTSEIEGDDVVWSYNHDQLTIEQHIEDQLVELERLMDFYRFSMHQGERSITHIVLYGENPFIDVMETRLTNRFEQEVIQLKAHDIEDKRFDTKYIPAIGLALKGGK